MLGVDADDRVAPVRSTHFSTRLVGAPSSGAHTICIASVLFTFIRQSSVSFFFFLCVSLFFKNPFKNNED